MEIISLIGAIATLIGIGSTVWQIWQQHRCNRTKASRTEEMQAANEALRAEVKALQQKVDSIRLEHNRQLHGIIQSLIERQGRL